MTSQLSLFSADLIEPRPADLGGLLAAHGQIVSSATGARLSILLSDMWRAEALVRECRVRDIVAELLPAPVFGSAAAGPVGPVGPAGVVARAEPQSSESDGSSCSPRALTAGQVLLRTERSAELLDLAVAWTRGAIKAVPPGLTAHPGLLRCWTIAAGRPDEAGFLLGFDPHAPTTFEPLAAACAKAGIAGSLIRARGGGPGLRIVGYRRMARLAETVGTPPQAAPSGAFPVPHR